MDENEKKRRKEEIERRNQAERERGNPVNKAEARNKESWMRMQGYNRLRELAPNAPDTFWTEVAIGKHLPEVDTPPGLGDCVAENPNKPASEKEALIRKNRAALKNMIKAGALVGSAVPQELLDADTMQRRKPANVYLAKALSSEGLHHKTLAQRLASTCEKIGRIDFDRLPGSIKADILTGAKVHPLSLTDNAD